MQIKVVLVVFFLACLTGFVQAQSLDPNYALKRAIYDGDRYIKFHVLDPDVRIGKLDPNKFYTWTKSQKIQTTQGGASGDLLNGEYSSYYKNNQLEEQGQYKRGLKHGIWIKWNEDGKMISRCKFKNGQKSGHELVYNNEGVLLFDRVYHGKKTRTVKEDSLIIQKESESKIIVFGTDGIKEQVIRTRSSNLHGKQYERLTDTSVYLSRYRSGKLIWEKEKVDKHHVRSIWHKIKSEGRKKETKEENTNDSNKDKKPKLKKEKNASEKK